MSVHPRMYVMIPARQGDPNCILGRPQDVLTVLQQSYKGSLMLMMSEIIGRGSYEHSVYVRCTHASVSYYNCDVINCVQSTLFSSLL